MASGCGSTVSSRTQARSAPVERAFVDIPQRKDPSYDQGPIRIADTVATRPLDDASFFLALTDRAIPNCA
ncbi:hypothetical protein AN948_00270 [Rhodococcus sp. ADH]|nr:hypothetical protein AN948_00270 [Rhodococcus sp. ADH]RGP43327.1 hypothetical protein AWH04_28550 [Rhodococcus erythropolis]